MAQQKKPANRYKTKPAGGGRIAVAVIVALVGLLIASYFLFRPAVPAPPVARKEAPVVAVRPMPPRPMVEEKAVPEPKKTDEGSQSPVTASPVERRPEQKSYGKGELAVIIDDMGGSMQEARTLAKIGVPLTFSIIPGLRSYREVATFAASSGIETMIHIPMQSKGWPQRRLEANGLLVSMDEAEIRARLDEFTRTIPKAVGANNHMGSEFTEHEERMRVVLGVLKGKGLFFVDSVTSPNSAGLKLARSMGVPAARRSVFLDNEQNETYIRGQLAQAVRLARRTGGVIVICHPHPATLRTLATSLPLLKQQGITLVKVSRLVR